MARETKTCPLFVPPLFVPPWRRPLRGVFLLVRAWFEPGACGCAQVRVVRHGRRLGVDVTLDARMQPPAERRAPRVQDAFPP